MNDELKRPQRFDTTQQSYTRKTCFENLVSLTFQTDLDFPSVLIMNRTKGQKYKQKQESLSFRLKNDCGHLNHSSLT